MKKIFYIILSLLVIFSNLSIVYASDIHIEDKGNIFNEFNNDDLKTIIAQYQNKYSFHIVIVTTSNIDEDFDFQTYSDYYYQNLYQQEDGIIFGFCIQKTYNKEYKTKKIINSYGNISQYIDKNIDADEILGNDNYEYVNNIQTILYNIGLKIDGLTSPRYVIDQACMLSYDEYQMINQKIELLQKKYHMDFVIMTKSHIDKYISTYADDYYDNGNYLRDGLILVIDLEARRWYISTSGIAIKAFTDWGISYIGKEVISRLLRDGAYVTFNNFLDYTNQFMIQYETGYPYDENFHYGLPNSNEENISESTPQYYSHQKSNFFQRITISLILSVFIAFIINVWRMDKNKNVKKAVKNANSYIKKDSFQLTRQENIFLYSTITQSRRPDPDDSNSSDSSHSSGTHSSSSSHSSGSSTHTSSSGATHGGGGGRF